MRYDDILRLSYYTIYNGIRSKHIYSLAVIKFSATSSPSVSSRWVLDLGSESVSSLQHSEEGRKNTQYTENKRIVRYLYGIYNHLER
jgi:hypothetical protein